MSDAFDPYLKWLGIPPKDRPADFYRLLGVERFESDPDVITNAADQRMAHLKNFGVGKYAAHSQRILNEIAAARVCLLNQEKKAHHDAALQERLKKTAAPAAKPKLAVAMPCSISARATANRSEIRRARTWWARSTERSGWN
jgi:hypothetical protein